MSSSKLKIKDVNTGDSEKDIEKYLCIKIKQLGGTAYKFSSPAKRSVPDRLCVLPNGIIIFIECKAPGKKPTLAQCEEINKLHNLRQLATWVDCREDVKKVCKELKAIINASTKDKEIK